jgi:hypothetical protein
MRSSISSSDRGGSASAPGEQVAFDRPGFARLTASDRPGVAQPVPERDIPARPWQPIFIGMLLIVVVLMAGWEMVWRAYGVTPGYRNSNGEWAAQRRRIDQGEGGKTVLIGSSRTLFDVQLPVWERITGERPIQLAIEGTSPLPMLEDLAADADFTGRLMVGIAPQQFFGAFAYRADVLPYYRKQSPSQRSGNWLSMHFLEPYFAFYDPDFALATLVRRQPWPARSGVHQRVDVRKLSVQEADRNSHLWSKLENDAEYREMARSRWAQMFGEPLPGMETPEKKQRVIDEQIARAAAAVATLRKRGVPVLFLRAPSGGPYLEYEQRMLPRTATWDVLLQRTGAAGIHFQDYPELQGYDLPEWSHLSAADANRFTAALVPIIQRDFWRRDDRRVAR